MTPPRRLHAAIVHPRYVPLILSGAKTIECRLTRARVPPFECAGPGERVYFKARSGVFRCAAVIVRAEFLRLTGPESVAELRAAHNDAIRGESDFWQAKASARFASLLFLCDAEPIDAGPDLSSVVRHGDRRAWHVLPAELEPAGNSRLF
ncbi:MAG: ASCH domain-containing protein [Phycisphaeraceae bacterium]|nr:ASCH domain-containing protein [Phycisphaeraceae bacterium]